MEAHKEKSLLQQQIDELIEQRDELLESVKMFAEYEKAMDERDDVSGMLIYAEMSKLMHAAIAKATSK